MLVQIIPNNKGLGVITMENKLICRDIFRDYPDVVDVEQMSEMLGISTKTAYKILKENQIEHFKISANL